MEISVSIPLDSDGFLRRLCPHCSRTFKWLASDDSDSQPQGGYACPYCRARADDFTTPEQADYLVWHAGQVALRELAESGFTVESSPAPPLPVDPGDMTRVDFSCHPGEPAKVYEDWIDRQPVYCIVCGDERE